MALVLSVLSLHAHFTDIFRCESCKSKKVNELQYPRNANFVDKNFIFVFDDILHFEQIFSMLRLHNDRSDIR